MKKIAIFSIALIASTSMFAQNDVVKNVERELKGSNPNYSQILVDIQPALTNPETAGTMMPWFLAGEAAHKSFDRYYMLLQTQGDIPAADKKAAGLAYIDGYNYYLKALQLDSVPDAKGKVKPKKSKEILNKLAGGHPYMRTVAILLMQANDFDDAAKAWDLYATLPMNPLLAKNPPAQLPDSVYGESLFYEAQSYLAADQVQSDPEKVRKAAEILAKVMRTSHQEPNVYAYGVMAANRLNDKDMKNMFAQAGYDKYGTADITFVGELINSRLDVEDYAGALKYVEEGIAATSADNTSMLAQLYTIQGIINQRNDDFASAQASYKKALELNPNSPDAMYNLAQTILAQVDKKTMENMNLTVNDFKADVLEAADLLKKVYEIDDVKYHAVPDNLYRIYYNLGKDYINESKYWEQLR